MSEGGKERMTCHLHSSGIKTHVRIYDLAKSLIIKGEQKN